MEATLMGAVFAGFSQLFSTAEMHEVPTASGFDVMTKIEYLDDYGVWRSGALAAIGEKAKKPDGTLFTVFMVAKADDMIEPKEIAQIRHHLETQLPHEWAVALQNGWKIQPSFGGCGCSHAWMKPRPSGAHEMFGCVGHSVLPKF